MRKRKHKIDTMFGADGGNFGYKLVSDNGAWFLRHALAPLQDNQWSRVMAVGSTPEDGYYLINDSEAYAVGDKAIRKTFIPRKSGRERYERGYMGVLTAVALYRAIGVQGEFSVDVLMSYPPSDFEYRHELMNAVAGRWSVFGSHGTTTIHINPLMAVDEPLGSLAYFGVNENGTLSGNTTIAEQTFIVVDIGGLTIDTTPIEEGMSPDYTSFSSIKGGTIKLQDEFWDMVQHRYRDKLRSVSELDPRRIEEGLLTGRLPIGSKHLDVRDESTEALNLITNKTMEAIYRAGGAENYERILLAGGGANLIYNHLKKAYPYTEVTLASPDRNYMQFTNADGYRRLYRLMKLVEDL